jgi:hypothetical protein
MPNITDRTKAEEKIREYESFYEDLAAYFESNKDEAQPLDGVDIPPVEDQLHDKLYLAQAHGLLAIRQAIRELDETLRYLFKQKSGVEADRQRSNFILLKLLDEDKSILVAKSDIWRVTWRDEESCWVHLRDEALAIENGNLVQFASDLGAF